MRTALRWLWRAWVFGGAAAFLVWKGSGDAFVWLILWCGIAYMVMLLTDLVKGRLWSARNVSKPRDQRDDGHRDREGFREFDEHEWPRRSADRGEAVSSREADLRAQLQASQELVAELRVRNGLLESETRAHLQSTQRLVAALEQRNALLENELAEAAMAIGNGHPLFRRVGLDAKCPEWVAAAVRREYRKRFHPDLHSGANKDKAERAFKDAEGVFDQIWTRRGFR